MMTSQLHPRVWLSAGHQLAADLEACLRDPMDDETGPFSYRAIVEAEERDELPAGAVKALRGWGFQNYLVPRHLGGRLTTLEEVFFLTRTLSRRNVTLAVMLGSTLLAANPVWLWGSPEQQRTLADGILDGDLACFGVSEADHGSDVVACEALAEPVEDGLLLNATKWPVGNAARGRFVTVYAKTGARDFSLMLVDKHELAPGSWSALPPVKTVGLRGHDLSGIAFANARVPAHRVVGRPGSGLVQTLKTLQITRTAIAALSIGTMDSVMRIGLDYARDRTLYGSSIYELPVIRDHLVKAHLDLLIAECVAVPVTRSLSLAPGRLSLWSSIVKYFVPILGEEVVASVGTVLAARSYLREGVAHGAFQKLQRDHAIASIFEGTTHVNLSNVSAQLPHVLEDDPPTAAADRALLADLFSWTRTPPPWRPDGRELQLTNEGRDEIGAGYESTIAAVLETAAADAPEDVTSDLVEATSRIAALRSALQLGFQSDPGDTNSVAQLRRARRYCEIHAMLSCMLTWLHNRDELRGSFAEGRWLVLCLQRLLQRAQPDAELSEAHVPELERAMLRCLDEGQWFTLLSLADGAPAASPYGD